MSDSTPPSKKRVIQVGSDRRSSSKRGPSRNASKHSSNQSWTKRGPAKGGHRKYGQKPFSKPQKFNPSDRDGNNDTGETSGTPWYAPRKRFDDAPRRQRSERGYESRSNSRYGSPRSDYRKGNPRPNGRRIAAPSRGITSPGTTPKPVTKARIKLRNFWVIDAVLRREEDLGYYQYFVDLPNGASLRISSISAEHTRLYGNLSATERTQPLTLLVYPRFDTQSTVGDVSSSVSTPVVRQVNAVALGGIYRGAHDTPPSYLPKELQTNTGYFTAKFLEATPDGFGTFKIAQKADATKMQHLSFDLSQVTETLQPEHWVDLRYTLEPADEQFKIVVQDVISQDGNGAVSGWNDPCYSEPQPETEEDAVEEVQPQRRRWRRVERPIKKGKFKYEVR